jgi:hypothetical protein
MADSLISAGGSWRESEMGTDKMLPGKAEEGLDTPVILYGLPDHEGQEGTKSGLGVVLVVEWVGKVTSDTGLFMCPAKGSGIGGSDHQEAVRSPDCGIKKRGRGAIRVEINGIKAAAGKDGVNIHACYFNR